MSTHTAGPWTVRRFDRNIGKVPNTGFHVIDGQGVVISEAFPAPHAVAINEANARLIASAPDLLAALRLMVAAGEESARSSQPYPPPVECMAIARAAIAKATGP